jgi:hypothetical protein
MRWAGHEARMRSRRMHIAFWVGKPKVKIPLGRSGRRWMDNIKMEFREIGLCEMDRIDLTSERDQWRVLLNMVIDIRVP